MRITEVTKSKADALFESLDRENNTGFSTEDLVKIYNESTNGTWSAGQGADKPFMRCGLYATTYAVRIQPYPQLRKKFRDFMELKRHNPMAPFGDSDKSFKGGLIFDSAIPGLRHAHITMDISIVYRIAGRQVFLYGFFTHDDLGTGQPKNVARQRNVAQRLSNQKFNE